jgi:hypothetical protein
MARVTLLDEKEHPELSELIAKIKGARGGRLINIYRLMLSTPALAGPGSSSIRLSAMGLRSTGSAESWRSYGWRY